MSCKSMFVSPYEGEPSDHFDGKKFYNKVDDFELGSFSKLMWYQLTHKRGEWEYQINKERTEPISKTVHDHLGCIFINHATVLIQMEGKNILTDPVFVKRASPYTLMGPGRHREPAIAFEDLPPIDVVLISHDHYDHLDVKTLKKLSDKYHCKILVGLGLKSFLEKFDIPNIKELDWEENIDIDGIKYNFHTAIHWSNRSIQPYRTLWGAWMIEGKEHNVYFAGDTGYGDHFKEIKNKYSQIDLALIPIGAYKPRFFMQNVHMAPEDAVRAHQDLDPKHSIGIHWGTFKLTYEAMYDPLEELDTLFEEHEISNFYYDKYHNINYKF